MTLNTFPLVVWGTAADISSAGQFSSFGSITVTPGQADPFGGTGAYLLDDTDAANNAARLSTSFTGTTSLGVIAVCMKAGSAGGSRIAYRDSVGYKITINVTWSGGVPSYGSVLGTALTPIAMGGGWYLFVSFATDFVPGASWRYELYATAATASLTGTTVFYVRNLVALDLLNRYRRFPRPREGYEADRAPSGVEDSWTYGNDTIRRAEAKWIPSAPRDWPASVSGFDGPNDRAGINVGVDAMLKAGWDKQDLLWVPDRSISTVNQATALHAPPPEWEPTIEPNGDLSFELELVTPSAPGLVP